MILAIAVVVTAGCLLNRTVYYVGAIMIILIYLFLSSVLCYLLFSKRRGSMRFDPAARTGLTLLSLTTPFYITRLVYLALVIFASMAIYNPVVGDWRYVAGMEFAMEVPIVLLLLASSLVVEPVHKRRELVEAGAELSSLGEPKAEPQTAF